MVRSFASAALLFAVIAFSSVVFSSGCGAVELRPVAPGWQELTVKQDKAGLAISSRLDTEVIDLKLSGGQVEVLRTDPTLIAVDNRRISLDHLGLVDAFRGKPRDAVLAAYHDFITADLQRRGWKELVAERTKFSGGGKAPALYWAMQAEAGSAGKTSTVTLSLAAAVTGSSVVALTAIAEDGQAVAMVKRILLDALATLGNRKGNAMGGDIVARLRQDAQRLVYQVSNRGNVILLNDELASPQDRQKTDDHIQHYILSPSDTADAAASAVAGSPNGPFMTFVNDGRSQHALLIHAYDAAAVSFEYSDTTGSRSLLEAGNNLADVEAVRKPDTTDRLWVVKKDQLQRVLSGMIIGEADLLAVGRKVHLGPLGVLGNTPGEATQTDFFKYFHLEETGKSPAADAGMTISYAPNAPKYRPLVAVRLQVAQGGWLRGAELVVKRRLLEDPREENSARDIAKSFIEAATLQIDWNKVHRLHDEIFYLGSTRMMISEAAAKDIIIPLLPSAGYEVFAGRRGHFVDMLSRSRLWMENVVADGEPALLISVGAGS